MAISRDELIASIQKLRERRMAIPELRDYRPQSRKGTKTSAKSDDRDVADIFGDLIKPEGEEGGES